MYSLKKCGDMYIKFDENNNPEYAFECSDWQIKKFFCLKKKLPNEIILPNLLKSPEFIPQTKEEMQVLNHYRFNYLSGIIQISKNCFHGLQNATIVMPYDTSVSFKPESFDKNSTIKFVTPDNITLKTVVSIHNSETESWFLLADKNIKAVNLEKCIKYEVADHGKKSAYFEIEHRDFSSLKSDVEHEN